MFILSFGSRKCFNCSQSRVCLKEFIYSCTFFFIYSYLRFWVISWWMSCTAQSLLFFIHQEVGCRGAAWATAGGGGGAPFDVGLFVANENADPADMGAAEPHQNRARREWDELRSSREWRSVEKHFVRCDRRIGAIFEKARAMYRDGRLALDIEDESFSSAVNAIISEAQAVARLTSQIASSPPRKKNQRSQVPWASSEVSSQSCAF